MTKYPLTYAVFYRSIIEPQTLLHQYEVNNALFSGDINLSDTHPDFIGSVMGNGYVSGSKTIRGELIQKIQNTSAEELASHVRLLNLRDIPTIILTIRKLLAIADISDSLRDRLLEKADTVSEELFIAEIFQQSLKYHNKKLRLSNEDKEFLNNLSNYDVNEPNISQDEEKSFEDSVNDTSSFTSPSDRELSNSYDEIDRIIEQARNDELNTIDPDEDSAHWKRIHLPDDFERLMNSVAPLLIEEKNFISLDLADVTSVCHLDLETKTCRDGYIEILVVSCSKNDTSMYTNALKQIKNCTDVLIHISGDVNLMEVEDLTKGLYEYIEPDANIIWGLRFDECMGDRYVIQVICYIKDPVKEDDILSQEDISRIIDSYMDSIVVEKPKEERKEIDIPYFLRR